LSLVPQPATGVRLKADFGGIEKSDLFVRLRRADSRTAETIFLRQPDYESTNEALAAGEYELRLSSQDYYLVAPYRITVRSGQVTPYTITLGNEFASLHGRVRVAGGTARTGASHFTVGVRGAERRRKMQADQDGRFVFDKLPPGDYEVAAWPKPDVDVENDDAWSNAGSVNKVQLEAGFNVEVNLTAAP
jgi:hypothetical protein